MLKPLDPNDPIAMKSIKASIIDAIAREIVGSSRRDIEKSVEKEYKRLLAGATIFVHTPALTAGAARWEAMAKVPKAA